MLTRATIEVRADGPSGDAPYDGSMSQPADQTSVKKVLLAAPRGYCAGVDRDVVDVEKALQVYGPLVYVRKQIMHTKHVLNTLEKRCPMLVDETDEVPECPNVNFCAPGMA